MLTHSRCLLKPAPTPSFTPIPHSELLDGHWYEGTSQETKYAYWDKKIGRFKYLLEKHGFIFVQEIEHPEKDKSFDTFYPQSRVPYGRTPKAIVEAGVGKYIPEFTKPSFEVKSLSWQ